MKAKTFIEYWKSPITEVMSIHKAYDLLSRPFKPEDITEFFDKVNHNDSSILIIKFKEHLKWIYTAAEENRLSKTVDQFISDNQRDGIELFWKEEIVNQYFK